MAPVLVRVRPERPDDHEAVDDVVSSAFGRRSEAEFVRRVRASDHYLNSLALVAETDGELLGQALFSWIRLEAAEPRAVLALAPASVRPAAQGKGVGSALVRAGLARADSSGAPLVIVVGHPTWYPRFGFEPARAHGIEPPWPDVPDPVFMVRRLSGFTDRCRGQVVFPEAFAGI
jgi:putative acetyltransferase